MKVLVILTTSPCFDWRLNLINSISKKENTESILLYGINSKDVELQLLRKFSNWAKYASKSLIDTLRELSEGKQAQLSAILSYLKESCLVQVVNHTLNPVGNIEDLKRALSLTSDEFLLYIFDNLKSKEFQKVLKISSVIGREFSLEEVAHILTKKYPKYYNRALSRLKTLVKINNYDSLIAVVMNGKNNPLHPYENNYQFTNMLMRDAIYNHRLTRAERSAIHLDFVRLFESEITDANETTFIPRICYHYSNSNCTDRENILQHIKYMVMLGNYICLIAEMYMETITLYTKIKQMIEENELEEVLGANIVSEIHSRLGHAYRHGLPDEINPIQSLRNLMIAIDILQFHWPKTDTQWLALIFREGLVWGFHNFMNIFKITNKKISKSKKKRNRLNIQWLLGRDEFYRNQRLDRLEHLQPILEEISRSLLETDARVRDQIGCDLLILNNGFRMGLREQSGSKLSLSFATNFWFSGYPNISRKIANRIKDKYMDPQALAVGAHYWTVCGEWKTALQWAENGMELSQIIGKLLLTLAISIVGKFVQSKKAF
jgi:hypothetical protein